MTAKEKVLAKFPEAVCRKASDGLSFVVVNGEDVRGRSTNPRGAWSDAAKKLPEDKSETKDQA